MAYLKVMYSYTIHVSIANLSPQFKYDFLFRAKAFNKACNLFNVCLANVCPTSRQILTNDLHLTKGLSNKVYTTKKTLKQYVYNKENK